MRRDGALTLSAGELRLSNAGQAELLRASVATGAPLRMRVRGSSMAPFIRDNDVVTIAPANGRGPRIGEIVAFVRPGTRRLLVHRVISRAGSGWVVRGDNSLDADGLVAAEDILGVLQRVERGERTVRLGLGPEARLVAWLQRARVLRWATRQAALLRRILKPRRAAR